MNDEDRDTSASDPGDGAGSAQAEASLPWETESDAFRESPEIFVGAAFLGGLVLARVLRRLSG